MTKKELEFSTRLTREDVAGLIEALIEGLKDGRLKVQKSGKSLELEVPRVVDLEIEASIDDERAEFEIEVSWRTNRAENPDDPPQSLPGSGKGAKAAKPVAKKPAAAKKPAKAGAKPAPAKTAAAAKDAKKTPAKAKTTAAAASKSAGKSAKPAAKVGAKKSAAATGKAKA